MKKILLKAVVPTLLLCMLTTTLALADTTYTVQRGDTMYKIASKHGVTVSQLMSANPAIKNASLIYVGQKITIPSTKMVTYTVQRGDTMYAIAKRFEISYSELLKANPSIKNPAMIYVGQKITIPDTKSLTSYEQQVFELVNRERASRGLATFKYSNNVAHVARLKSQDMINKKYFSHTSPTYGSPFEMMEQFGLRFSAAGENIAYGQRTAAEVMNAWMNSPGHRANILSSAYTTIGVGVAKAANGTLYWTQMFINPY
jgi:uncharacterized YkwD family protein